MADGRGVKDWWNFQFEPAAWLGDPGVQSLSWADQGMWLRLLLAMHGSPRRGVLLYDSGAPMDGDGIASLLRISPAEWEQTRNRLLTRGVASLDDPSGALYNRKMLRDSEKHERMIEAKRAAGIASAEARGNRHPTETNTGGGNKNNNNNKNKNNVTGPHSRKGAPTTPGNGNTNTTHKNNNHTPPGPLAGKPRGTTPGNGHDGGGHDDGSPRTDPLNSVNFRAGLLLLLSTGMSEPVAKGFAGEHPVGRLAAVVVAAAGQKSPAGWTRTALEKNYVVADLDETERAKILKTLDELPRLELPETARGGRRAGESSDAYFARVAGEAAAKKSKADAKKAAADGATATG